MVMIEDQQTEMFPAPKRQRPRSPDGINVHLFLEGHGINCLPRTEARGWKEREANVIYGGRTVARLMRKDMARAELTIRCIQASDPKCFEDVIIWAVWKLIDVHFSQDPAIQTIERFKRIDLSSIKKRSHAIVCGKYGRGTKTWTAIYSLMAVELLEI